MEIGVGDRVCFKVVLLREEFVMSDSGFKFLSFIIRQLLRIDLFLSLPNLPKGLS